MPYECRSICRPEQNVLKELASRRLHDSDGKLKLLSSSHTCRVPFLCLLAPLEKWSASLSLPFGRQRCLKRRRLQQWRQKKWIPPLATQGCSSDALPPQPLRRCRRTTRRGNNNSSSVYCDQNNILLMPDERDLKRATLLDEQRPLLEETNEEEEQERQSQS